MSNTRRDEPETDSFVERLREGFRQRYDGDGDGLTLADGDCAPRDAPDGEVNAGDVVVGVRMALGIEIATALELAHCDLYPENNPDGVFNIPDLLLLMQLALTSE